MRTECKMMHIERADEIAMSCELTDPTRPSSSFGLLSMSTSGTPAAGSSFGAGEAQDAGLLCLVHQIVDIAAIFP